MKSFLFFWLAALSCWSCHTAHFKVHRSADLPASNYSRSFAFVQDEGIAVSDQEMLAALKLQFIEHKWIYDDVSPDVLVSVVVAGRAGRWMHFSGVRSDFQKQMLTVDKGSLIIRMIDPTTYLCFWQGLATDLPHNRSTFTYSRVVSSLIQ